MNRLGRTGAVVALTLTLAVCALAGTIHSPGSVDPPPPTSEETRTSTTTTTTSIATDVILTILSVIS